MEQYKASFQLVEYIVNKAEYNMNSNFIPSEDESLEVNFDIEAIISYEDNADYITLKSTVGDSENNDCPFLINVEITGIFEFDGDDNSREQFLKTSGTAALFPYLRSLISEMSSISNIFPTFRLPLINVMEYLQDENRIIINDNRLDN
jgi:preprotein translocase subunit SecB